MILGRLHKYFRKIRIRNVSLIFMKKRILFLTLLFSSLYASEEEDIDTSGACKLTGIYTGAETGASLNRVKISVNQYTLTQRRTRGLFGILLGYGWGKESGFYIGTDIGLQFTNARIQRSATFSRNVTVDTDVNGPVVTQNQATVSANLRRTVLIPLSVRAGYLIGSSALLFARLGIDIAPYRAKASVTLTQFKGVNVNHTKSIQKSLLIPIPFIGIGVDYFITNHCFMRAAYQYNFLFGKARITKRDNVISTQLSYASNSFKLGLGWKF